MMISLANTKKNENLNIFFFPHAIVFFWFHFLPQRLLERLKRGILILLQVRKKWQAEGKKETQNRGKKKLEGCFCFWTFCKHTTNFYFADEKEEVHSKTRVHHSRTLTHKKRSSAEIKWVPSVFFLGVKFFFTFGQKKKKKIDENFSQQ